MSDQTIRVLVTGVGGDLGQALVKCLRLIDRPIQVFGCDAASESVGAAFVDEFFVSPFASEKDYLSKIQDICQKKYIQVVIPGCEADIFKLSQAIYQYGFSCGAAVLCHDYAPIFSCFRRES
jgi:carbamoyl-phosphate synthase large subunit